MAYHSLESIAAYCREHGASFYEAVLADDREERDTTAEESLSRMAVLRRCARRAAFQAARARGWRYMENRAAAIAVPL